LTNRGHDALHVRDRGVDARPDSEVAAVAAREGHALVTENVKDIAAENDLVMVYVMKSRLRTRGMTEANPHPYVSLHWPQDND
jgi:Domain of unknown function (DUF5615)